MEPIWSQSELKSMTLFEPSGTAPLSPFVLISCLPSVGSRLCEQDFEVQHHIQQILRKRKKKVKNHGNFWRAVSLQLLDGFWILVAQMKRKDAYVTNKRKSGCFHCQKHLYLAKHQAVSPRCWCQLGCGSISRSFRGDVAWCFAKYKCFSEMKTTIFLLFVTYASLRFIWAT